MPRSLSTSLLRDVLQAHVLLVKNETPRIGHARGFYRNNDVIARARDGSGSRISQAVLESKFDHALRCHVAGR
ncbi:MAG: hypothetical protein JWO45_163, partial [Spartobacteria bacterium]|nr:hypothetical protein [Spartobacteria bacterium]